MTEEPMPHVPKEQDKTSEELSEVEIGNPLKEEFRIVQNSDH